VREEKIDAVRMKRDLNKEKSARVE